VGRSKNSGGGRQKINWAQRSSAETLLGRNKSKGNPRGKGSSHLVNEGGERDQVFLTWTKAKKKDETYLRLQAERVQRGRGTGAGSPEWASGHARHMVGVEALNPTNSTHKTRERVGVKGLWKNRKEEKRVGHIITAIHAGAGKKKKKSKKNSSGNHHHANRKSQIAIFLRHHLSHSGEGGKERKPHFGS